MWKTNPEEPSNEKSDPMPLQGRSVVPSSAPRTASLGPSLVIRGTLSGQEDLLIEGRVEGEISLRKHNVTVGQKGRVKADIFSKSIFVEGEVHGNLFGEDQVTIRRSGRVRGNVTSPRVSLEDGSKFKGAIDMNAPAPAQAEERPTKGRGARQQQESAKSDSAAEKKNLEPVSAKSAEG